MSDQVRFNADGLVLSEGYADTMNRVVLPWINARRSDAVVEGDGGRPIFTSRFDAGAPRGTVVIVHGFTETVEKFSELIHSLLRNGFSVLAYDQRGHGRSWRAEGIDDLSLTHVDDFGEYVRDLEIICRVRLAEMPKPWLLFAHSMGGAVSALYMEKHPNVFARAALCAPMIAPNRSGVPLAAGKLLCRVAKAVGRGKKRIFFSRPYAGAEDFATSCATGKARFDWYEALRVATPRFQNNGPSYGWTLESLNVTGRILAPGAVEKIAASVRVYTAENDASVLPDAQEQFAARLKSGRRALVKGAKHEIYRSADEVLFPWWHGILMFLGEQGDE